MEDKELLKELQEVANEKEAEELFNLAQKLQKEGQIERSWALKYAQLEKILGEKQKRPWHWPAFFGPALAFVFLVVFSASSAIFAQSSLPGEPLYPIKRASEKVITIINPNFAKEIPVRRSQEVKDLLEKKKGKEVKETLKEFRSESKKSGTSDQNKVNKSLNNLEEAKKSSDEENRSEIEKVIEEVRSQNSGSSTQEVKGEEDQTDHSGQGGKTEDGNNKGHD